MTVKATNNKNFPFIITVIYEIALLVVYITILIQHIVRGVGFSFSNFWRTSLMVTSEHLLFSQIHFKPHHLAYRAVHAWVQLSFCFKHEKNDMYSFSFLVLNLLLEELLFHFRKLSLSRLARTRHVVFRKGLSSLFR